MEYDDKRIVLSGKPSADAGNGNRPEKPHYASQFVSQHETEVAMEREYYVVQHNDMVQKQRFTTGKNAGNSLTVTEEKVLALLLMHVLIEAVRHGQRKSGSHGLHEPQELPRLIIGKARHNEQDAGGKAHDPASGKLCREAVEERRQRPVQHKVQRDDPLDVVSDQKELRPGRQPVDETAAGRSQRKHILEKALLSPAGPHVEIVHIVTGHPDLPVHKECPGEQDPDQDDIRPVILFLSPGSLRDIHKVYSPPVR